jgi:hypothetical protein
MLTRIPWRILGYIAAGVLALAAINHGLQYVPFSPQWSAKRSAAKADRLEARVSILERTAAGNAEIAEATNTYHTREVVIRDLTARAETEARRAPDADAPLSDERANRLRDADRRLCDASPGLCPAADAP